MSVKVNSAEADKRIAHIMKGLGPSGLSSIGKATVRLLDYDAKSAISSTTAPSGKPWEVRKTRTGWAPLQHTGQLLGSMSSNFKNFGSTLLVRGAVKGGSRSDGRRHGLVGGVQQFGRSSGSKYGRMPARKFMGLARNSYRTIQKLADRLMGKG